LALTGNRAATDHTKGKRKMSKKQKESEEYQNFQKLAKQLISVPKSEIDKREAEYQKHKKTAKKKRVA
jgi:hypothetical protein